MLNVPTLLQGMEADFIRQLKNRYPFRDPILSKGFEAALNRQISKGPYIELSNPFKTACSLRDLIANEVLSSEFLNMSSDGLNLDMLLYQHQYEALLKLQNNQDIVLTTGTGSGKTNSFLIPILDNLLKEKQTRGSSSGVKAILLYPMKALAHDQLEGLAKVLKAYPDITFGKYDGGVEEEEERPQNMPVNFLADRKTMKETPPNILLTNYAMLEYLLLRPQDKELFKNADLRFVVLDEAHTYAGTKGVDISLLLRRLDKAFRNESKALYILASATLGSGPDADKGIAEFASDLISKKVHKDQVIHAARIKYLFEEKGINYPASIYKEIFTDLVINNHSYSGNGLTISNREDLPDFLFSSHHFHRLQEFNGKIVDMEKMAEELDLDVEDLQYLLFLSNYALRNGQDLSDIKYHFFVRAPEGVFVELCDPSNVSIVPQEENAKTGNRYFEVGVCNHCGKDFLIGSIVNKRLAINSDRSQEVSYFYPTDEEILELDDDIYYLCKKCGRIEQAKNKDRLDCLEGEHKDFVIQIQEIVSDIFGVLEHLRISCPACNARASYIQRVKPSNNWCSYRAAASLFDSMPKRNSKPVLKKPKSKRRGLRKSKRNENLLSAQSPQSNPENDKSFERNQFLAFSDSRSKAAEFASSFQSLYDGITAKRGVYLAVLEAQKSNQYVLDPTVFIEKLAYFLKERRVFADSETEQQSINERSRRLAGISFLKELLNLKSRDSVFSTGLLSYHYPDLDDQEMLEGICESFDMEITDSNVKKARSLIDVLVGEILDDKAVDEGEILLTPEEREMIYRSKIPHYLTFNQDSDSPNHHKWMPSKTSKGNIVSSNRIKYVKRATGADDQQAEDFLNDFFYALGPEYDGETPEHKLVEKADDSIKGKKKSSLTLYQLPIDAIQLVLTTKDSEWFKCDTCGRLTPHNLDDHCINNYCNGHLIPLTPDELEEAIKNNVIKLGLNKDKLEAFSIREHSGQESNKRQKQIQNQFVNQEINAISCTTTFEMGVDIGDLEVVFMRNVPPRPDNYVQRAGRPGRSRDKSAAVVTFANHSSHDMTFYQDPKKMINGMIHAPTLDISNTVLFRRHANALILSYYFLDNPQSFTATIDQFVNSNVPEDLREWVTVNIEYLTSELLSLAARSENEALEDEIRSGEIFNRLLGNNGVLTASINEYHSVISQYEAAINDISDEKAKYALTKNKANYSSKRLIPFLSESKVLPRYGFPINNVKLEPNFFLKNSSTNMDRDLKLAISEYAPSAQVINDGLVYTSRYIKKDYFLNKDNGFHVGYIGTCPECKSLNYSEAPVLKEGHRCHNCGELIPPQAFQESLEPRNGFITENHVYKPGISFSRRYIPIEFSYLGLGLKEEKNSYDEQMAKKTIRVETRKNDSLIYYTLNYFYVCSHCGYTLYSAESLVGDSSAKKNMDKNALTINTEKSHHNPLTGHVCQNQKLRRKRLHHIFTTDAVHLSFPYHDCDIATMRSVMYAIVRAVRVVLNIEEREVEGYIESSTDLDAKYKLVLFDNVPGGAGYTKRIGENKDGLLQEIFRTAYEIVKECDCEPSCYKCLRTFQNQHFHDTLDRKKAAEFLKAYQDF